MMVVYTNDTKLNAAVLLHNFKVNSTGFLVQNYENLGDTNIEIFFVTFKQQIKSTQIKSENVIQFVRGLCTFFSLDVRTL